MGAGVLVVTCMAGQAGPAPSATAGADQPPATTDQRPAPAPPVRTKAPAPDASADTPAPDTPATDPRLEAFKAWLAREREGYGCDEGPGRFRNATVEAAYPGQHFYYVLTYTRGIAPPYAKSVSVVARVDDSAGVHPLSMLSLSTFQSGLKKISSSKDARRAAAAVLILSSCDPNERRWKLTPDRFKAKKESGGWKCTYHYDNYHASWVRFDKKGTLLEIGGLAPPVP